MQVSTKLFNDQQVRQFGKLTADIQAETRKNCFRQSNSEELLMTQLPLQNCLQQESKNSYSPI